MRWTKTLGNRAGRRQALIGVSLAFAVVSQLASAQAPSASANVQARPVVVLDAAHGGSDVGGSFSNGQQEKSFTLALSVRLRSLLTARGFKVVTTRESDATVDSYRRADIANHAQAIACISLHATEKGAGVHLFASSLSAAQNSRFTAWKTAQSAWVARSVALTGSLNSSLQHAGFHVTLSRTALPVIDSMTCPAVAVEVAPEFAATGQNNQAKAQSPLGDTNYQSRVAEALAAALLEWRSEARQQ
jgi:N-acetylmuramoyl-L-alanine amidase